MNEKIYVASIKGLATSEVCQLLAIARQIDAHNMSNKVDEPLWHKVARQAARVLDATEKELENRWLRFAPPVRIMPDGSIQSKASGAVYGIFTKANSV